VSSLTAELEDAARIGADAGGVSRFAWTPELAQANEWFLARLHALGLETQVDAAGNVIGRWDEGEGTAVLVGSHLDTVPRGGRFDGALGVLSALESVRTLKAEGVALKRPLWIVSFNDEEGSRFQTGMLGSRAFVGDLDLDDWRKRGVDEAMSAAGYDFERLPEARAVDRVGAYLEVHIEQGPVLEQEGIDIGIVTGIAGMLGFRVRLIGEANHAGTTPMAVRRDALAGAARVVLALREAALKRGDITANVGVLTVTPGGFNVIPGVAEFTIDVRAGEPEVFSSLDALVLETLERVAGEEQLGVEVSETHRKPPTPLDPDLQDLLAESAAEVGASARRMPSGAGHDAMVLAKRVPAAMLFVPSRGGISHSPEEFTAPELCELGAKVLTCAVRRLVT
jgi:allantoate deiminase